MKVILTPAEVKIAIAQYIRNNHLSSHIDHNVEVLHVMNTDGERVKIEPSFECDVVKKPDAPTPCMPQPAAAHF